MKSDHKNINLIVKKIRSCNYNLIDQAINELINLNSARAYKRLLVNTVIDQTGTLWVNPRFVVTGPKQPAMDYAFWEIIGSAPINILINYGIYRNRIKTIRFKRHKSIAHWTHGIEKFPKGILNFKNLQQLYFDRCDIDNIPNEIGNLLKLKELTCNSRNLKSLPEELGKLKKLSFLDLSGCSIKTLPRPLSEMVSLIKLCLSDNQLKELPVGFDNLVSLKKLDISINQFSVVPKYLNSLSQVEELDLSSNYIVELKNIFNLSSLINLNLANNKIDRIPEDIKKIQTIEKLILDYNCPIINITCGFSKLKNLKKISFYGSQAIPRLTRKLFNNRNDVNQYFKKVRRYYKEPHHELTYIKPPVYSWSSRYNKTPKSRYKKEIQIQIDTIKALLSSEERENFEKGIKLLKQISDINIFIGSTKSYLEISRSGELKFSYHVESLKRISYLKLINYYVTQNIDMSRFNIDRVKELKFVLNIKKYKPLKELLIFKNLTKLELINCDSDTHFKAEIFKQIEELTISNSSMDEFRLTKEHAPKLKNIEFIRAKISKVSFVDLRNLNNITSKGYWYSDKSEIDLFKTHNCPQLSEISLYSNTLTDLEMSELPSLKHIDISVDLEKCKLKLNTISSLEKIILNSCNLTRIPDFITKNKHVKVLRLNDNKLDENKVEFNTLLGLNELSLDKNNFTSLPSDVYDMVNLKYLSINKQIAKLDVKIKQLKYLKKLNLGWNDNTYRKHYYLLKGITVY